jgi:TrmH family RNA methyltransferase
MELTNALRKTVRGLNETKNRRELQLFVAEGSKCVLDTLDAFTCKMIIASRQWAEEHASVCEGREVLIATRADFERMSNLSTPPQVIAVYEIPQQKLEVQALNGQLILALDRVQDPGNLGTIVRLADWMGVHTILASVDTVDLYNPKVVQATMGSISRVKVHYVDLEETLTQLRGMAMNIYGTFLDGTSLYETTLTHSGVIVMGNEGRGISDGVAKLVTHRLLIPTFPADAVGAESLNVATATAITVSEFRRQSLTSTNGKG